MTDKPPIKEFGRRKLRTSAPEPASKRSGHVALLIMGTLAVGGGAYALMPNQSCAPAPSPAMASPAQPQNADCASRSSSGGSSHGSSRSSFYGGDSASRASAAPADSNAGGVTRGGFGSFARAFGFGGG